MSKSQQFAVYAYALLFTPVFYIVESAGRRPGLPRAARALLCARPRAALLFGVRPPQHDARGHGASLLAGCIYPTAMLSTMLLMNELPVGSTLGLLLIHVIAPAADTFAFAVGQRLPRPQTLPPPSAPNKTGLGRHRRASSPARARACCSIGCTRSPPTTSILASAAPGRARPGWCSPSSACSPR